MLVCHVHPIENMQDNVLNVLQEASIAHRDLTVLIFTMFHS
jgi:hypothetical protein